MPQAQMQQDPSADFEIIKQAILSSSDKVWYDEKEKYFSLNGRRYGARSLGKKQFDELVKLLHSKETYAVSTMPVMGELERGYELLRKYGFPIKNCPKLAKFLAERPVDLEKIARAAGPPPVLDSKLSVFEYAFPSLEKSILNNPKNWDKIAKGIIEMAQVNKRLSKAFFSSFSKVASFLAEYPEKWQGFVRMVKAAGSHSHELVWINWDDIAYELKQDPKRWDGIVRMAEATKGRSREFFEITCFFGIDCSNLIKEFPQEWEWFVKMVEAAGEYAVELVQYALPPVKAIINQSPGRVGEILSGLTRIAKASKDNSLALFSEKLSNCSDFFKNHPEQWEDFVRLFEKDGYCYSIIIYGFAKNGRKVQSLPELTEHYQKVKYYVNKIGKSEYTQKVIVENLFSLAQPQGIFNRLLFDKTGSTLIPLGGRLAGYMHRIVTQEAYDTWLRAEPVLTEPDGTVHCEEIVKKNGRPRIIRKKDSRIAVLTKYAGQALRSYHYENKDEEKEILRQMNWIMKQLMANQIYHGHPHTGNHTILKEKAADGKEKIVVKLIDWDAASSTSDDITGPQA